MLAASLVEPVGLVAGFLTTVSFVPQVWKVWRSKRADDLSLGMFSIFVGGVSLWLIYGLMLQSPSIIVANLITFVLAAALLVMKLRFNGR